MTEVSPSLGSRDPGASVQRLSGPRRDRAVALASHPLTLRLFTALILFSAWEYAGRVPVSAGFPGFIETMKAMAEMTADGLLVAALLITLQPLALGLAISAVIGIGLGIGMGLSRVAEWLMAPPFIVMQAAPMAALIPLLVFAYGIGLAAKVLTVCIMAMPVIVLNSYLAIRQTPASLIEMGRSFQGSKPQIILKIMLPSASPVIFAGLRLGAAAGFIGAILAELLITPTGIGDLITYNQSIAEYPKMYAAIFSVIALSVLFIEGLGKIEAAIFRREGRRA
ncbi:MAG: ABC transporter permease subunit [Alphaproteobacteria bacterium]|nr:ABC transporter permease subunit [Alphaproteobacteria bacterium]